MIKKIALLFAFVLLIPVILMGCTPQSNTLNMLEVKSKIVGTENYGGGGVDINQTNTSSSYKLSSRTYFFKGKETIILEAFAYPGYAFVGWYDGATLQNFVSDQPTIQVQLNASKSYFAHFAIANQELINKVYRVSFYIYTNGQQSNEGAYFITAFGKDDCTNFNHNLRYAISGSQAIAIRSGYTFLGWFDSLTDSTPLSTDTSYNFLTTQDKTIYAKVEPTE